MSENRCEEISNEFNCTDQLSAFNNRFVDSLLCYNLKLFQLWMSNIVVNTLHVSTENVASLSYNFFFHFGNDNLN